MPSYELFNFLYSPLVAAFLVTLAASEQYQLRVRCARAAEARRASCCGGELGRCESGSESESERVGCVRGVSGVRDKPHKCHKRVDTVTRPGVSRGVSSCEVVSVGGHTCILSSLQSVILTAVAHALYNPPHHRASSTKHTRHTPVYDNNLDTHDTDSTYVSVGVGESVRSPRQARRGSGVGVSDVRVERESESDRESALCASMYSDYAERVVELESALLSGLRRAELLQRTQTVRGGGVAVFVDSADGAVARTPTHSRSYSCSTLSKGACDTRLPSHIRVGLSRSHNERLPCVPASEIVRVLSLLLSPTTAEECVIARLTLWHLRAAYGLSLDVASVYLWRQAHWYRRGSGCEQSEWCASLVRAPVTARGEVLRGVRVVWRVGQ